jgi:methylated-DNA-[protein]-cysteine S-methyltransferase
MTIRYREIKSPVGNLLLLAEGDGLREIRFLGKKKTEPEAGWKRDRNGEPLDTVSRQLKEYFAGARREFDLPLAPQGTDFQLRVWNQLRKIPFGKTISYGELARRVGNPAASRAVGAANGRNPISIVVPCHRVIGSDGSLTGFGGGLDVKRELLKLENAILF